MKTRVISFHYTLTDSTGTVLDSSSGGSPLAFLEGAGNIIPGLESVLVTLKPGTKQKVHVAAKDAYGEVQEELKIQVPREQFPGDVKIKVGDRFRTGGGHHSPLFVVTELSDSHVSLDGNHPLAGKDLSFDVEIVSERPATEEEMVHGHAHGDGGHHHH